VRTPSAIQAQAITGALPGLWRLLTPAEQTTWGELASTLPARDALGQTITLSGYALYIACTRRLITIGITEPLTSAPTAPSVPPIYGFQASPLYNDPTDPTALYDIQLTTAEPLPNGFIPVLRASAAVSQARGNIRASNLRVIQAGAIWPSQPQSALDSWQAIYGTTPPVGTITFELSLVDPASGLVGAAVRTSTSHSFTPVPTPPPGDLTIQIEGTTVAVVSDGSISIEGTVIAD